MRKVAIVTLVETDSSAWIMENLNGLEPEKADMELISREVRISTQFVKEDVYACGDIHSPVFTLV